MLAYLKQCLASAGNKLTVYFAGATGLIELIPQWIHDYWAQLEQTIPHLATYHQAAIGTGVVLTMWARVRRDAKAAMQAAKGNP